MKITCNKFSLYIKVSASKDNCLFHLFQFRYRRIVISYIQYIRNITPVLRKEVSRAQEMLRLRCNCYVTFLQFQVILLRSALYLIVTGCQLFSHLIAILSVSKQVCSHHILFKSVSQAYKYNYTFAFIIRNQYISVLIYEVTSAINKIQVLIISILLFFKGLPWRSLRIHPVGSHPKSRYLWIW